MNFYFWCAVVQLLQPPPMKWNEMITVIIIIITHRNTAFIHITITIMEFKCGVIFQTNNTKAKEREWIKTKSATHFLSSRTSGATDIKCLFAMRRAQCVYLINFDVYKCNHSKWKSFLFCTTVLDTSSFTVAIFPRFFSMSKQRRQHRRRRWCKIVAGKIPK